MIALVVINAIGCYILMSNAPREQDDAYVQQSRTIVEQTLSKIAKTNQTVNSDYSAWSDAYENISINYDENWVKENYYSDITSANAVFRPGTGVLFAHASKDIATFRASLSEFVSTLDLSSHQKYNDNPVEKNVIVSPNTFVVLTNTIYALSMQPIRPDTQYNDVKPISQQPLVFALSLTSIDQSTIDEIATSFGLKDARLELATGRVDEVGNRISFQIKNEKGDVLGVVSWHDPKPGTKALQDKMLPFGLALFFISLLTIFVTQRTVTTQLRLAEEARQSAEAASRLKSTFLANVSHELRTPLNGIIGYAEIIEEDAREQGNETTARDATKVTKSASHLLHIINDLLDHSKIEAGKMDLNVSQITVMPILNSVIDTLKHQISKQNNILTFACDPDLGDAMLDATRFKQCIFNLVSNAAKFTSNGTIHVAARPVTRAEVRFLRISVKDTGIGMSPATLTKLFKPFAQADSETTMKFGGTGLGLAITKALVESMGGSVEVESTLGEGSVFTILIPRGAVSSTQSQALIEPLNKAA